MGVASKLMRSRRHSARHRGMLTAVAIIGSEAVATCWGPGFISVRDEDAIGIATPIIRDAELYLPGFGTRAGTARDCCPM